MEFTVTGKVEMNTAEEAYSKAREGHRVWHIVLGKSLLLLDVQFLAVLHAADAIEDFHSIGMSKIE